MAIKIGAAWRRSVRWFGRVVTPPIEPGDKMLLETGDFILLETGDKILLEA